MPIDYYHFCCYYLDDDTEFEDAVDECGYGKFHYLLLWVCGWANASDAIEVGNF